MRSCRGGSTPNHSQTYSKFRRRGVRSQAPGVRITPRIDSIGRLIDDLVFHARAPGDDRWRPSCKLFGSLLAIGIPLFRPHRHPGISTLLTRPEHIVHFFRDVHGIFPIYQAGVGQEDPKVPPMGQCFCSQPLHSRPVAQERHQKRRLCPSLLRRRGASPAISASISSSRAWNKTHLPFPAAEVRDRRFRLPNPQEEVTLPNAAIQKPHRPACRLTQIPETDSQTDQARISGHFSM